MKKKLVLSAILASSVANLSPIAFADIQNALTQDLVNDDKIQAFTLVSKEKLKSANGIEYQIRLEIKKSKYLGRAFNKLSFTMVGSAYAVFEENGEKAKKDLLPTGEDANVVFELVTDDKWETEYFIFSANSSMNSLSYPSSSIVFKKRTNEWFYKEGEQNYYPLVLE